MTRPILVGYDPTTSDHAPVEFAVAAAGFIGAPLIVLSVEAGAPLLAVGTGTGTGSVAAALGQPDNDLVADCTQALATLERELSAAGVSAECRKLQSTSAARALHEAAEGGGRRPARGRLQSPRTAGTSGARLDGGAPPPRRALPGRGRSARMDRARCDRDDRGGLYGQR